MQVILQLQFLFYAWVNCSSCIICRRTQWQIVSSSFFRLKKRIWKTLWQWHNDGTKWKFDTEEFSSRKSHSLTGRGWLLVQSVFKKNEDEWRSNGAERVACVALVNVKASCQGLIHHFSFSYVTLSKCIYSLRLPRMAGSAHLQTAHLLLDVAPEFFTILVHGSCFLLGC